MAIKRTVTLNFKTNDGKVLPAAFEVSDGESTFDISLSAGDLGAYTKAEVDSKISTVRFTKTRKIWEGKADVGVTITLPESINGKNVYFQVNGKLVSFLFVGDIQLYSESYYEYCVFHYDGNLKLKIIEGNSSYLQSIFVLE